MYWALLRALLQRTVKQRALLQRTVKQRALLERTVNLVMKGWGYTAMHGDASPWQLCSGETVRRLVY